MSNENPELEELGTHASGITDQFKTRKTEPTIIEPPVSSPGIYDKRTINRNNLNKKGVSQNYFLSS